MCISQAGSATESVTFSAVQALIAPVRGLISMRKSLPECKELLEAACLMAADIFSIISSRLICFSFSMYSMIANISLLLLMMFFFVM